MVDQNSTRKVEPVTTRIDDHRLYQDGRPKLDQDGRPELDQEGRPDCGVDKPIWLGNEMKMEDMDQRWTWTIRNTFIDQMSLI
ncbi:hypothetical protein F2Q68_00027159 [Brassica cretica]|uniref:Uncharacterized protein n=2 Tax=Brassica cretica TaxID=69181 RepID=A0ABQ7E050_BRACR|nr:hypothetical protein F2Q68_00027159 [Brassica cretica]KAF3582629.1 hypothetical protein DY000_02033976 [Brassica cretica]